MSETTIKDVRCKDDTCDAHHCPRCQVHTVGPCHPICTDCQTRGKSALHAAYESTRTLALAILEAIKIDEMANVRDVLVDGVRVQVTEDDITAACWAAECVTSPKLTAFEWLTFGARNTDLLTFVGIRCLICSRLIADDSLAEGVSAAETELLEGRDPLACTLSDFASPG